MSSRIGLGRAVVFGASSAAAPLVWHGVTTSTTIVVVALLAVAFAAWSWSMGCTSRSIGTLASTLVGGQLLVHLVLLAEPSDAGVTAHAAAHAHGAHAESATGPLGIAVMVALHVVAALLGIVVLRSLEQRAMRATLRCIDHVIEYVAEQLRARAPRASTAPVLQVRSGFQPGADSAHALHGRVLARGRARRGPPRYASPFHHAA